MKVVILCGSKGTRLREETDYRLKSMLPIGNRPILATQPGAQNRPERSVPCTARAREELGLRRELVCRH